MTGSPASKTTERTDRSRVSRRRRATGRHRAGQPGLNHCAAIPAVSSRLSERRSATRRLATRRVAARRPGARRPAAPAAPASRPTRRLVRRLATAASTVAVTTAVVVSGWYAYAGAAAIAQMMSP